MGAPGGPTASAPAAGINFTVETALASCFLVTVMGAYVIGADASKPLLNQAFFWTSSSEMRMFGSVTSILLSKNLLSLENLVERGDGNNVKNKRCALDNM